ncbi:hypothetical protein [Undibacterium squillarum]|uniref:Uncharacterized protein n=1 Tax=Undibacterium squillarum TaxID=1131567 RepID=A0ABQ2Y2E0_9BURK|nr:hypothetical protein [Undibacterium squillarum]GGX52079.1 hypothetical protein GCM10010946_33380 [Undibacterium squillarum]
MEQQFVQRRAYYKRGVFLAKDHRSNLQDSLSQALMDCKTLGKRKESLGEQSNNVRAIIYHRSFNNILFGILASYERGTHQLTIAEDDEAEMLSVEQVSPPESSDNKKREFLEGVCYFAILKNHVAIVQSTSLRSKHLERHLNWLLLKGNVITQENRISLSDFVVKATREKLEKFHVKEFEIGSPLIEMDPLDAISEQISPTKSLAEFAGRGVKALQQFFFENQLNALKLSDAIDGNINVAVKVSYRRTTTSSGHALLDTLANAARHLDEDEVKLKLTDGSTVKGSELKLSKNLRVESFNGVPNPDSIFPNMSEWLRSILDNQTIDP